jgi:hypothetical protein
MKIRPPSGLIPYCWSNWRQPSSGDIRPGGAKISPRISERKRERGFSSQPPMTDPVIIESFKEQQQHTQNLQLQLEELKKMMKQFK